MNKTEATKTVIGTGASIGSYTVVRSIVKANVAPKGPISAILIFMGSVGLAFWISDHVQSHVEAMIDDLVTKWTNAKSNITN